MFLDFKEAHNERKVLIERWQDIINEIKKRDIDINKIGENYAIAKQQRIEKEQLTIVFRKRYVVAQNENKEVEIKFETLSRIVSKKREELINITLKLQEFKDELQALKNELTTCAEKLILKRNNNNNLAQLVEERKLLLDKERLKYQQTKEKLELTKNSTIKVEQTAREAEVALETREKSYIVSLDLVKTLKQKLFKESQIVYDLKREETRLKSELVGAKSISKNLDFTLQGLDREASRQQELLYNAEFQIQQIERKISRGLGNYIIEMKFSINTEMIFHLLYLLYVLC